MENKLNFMLMQICAIVSFDGDSHRVKPGKKYSEWKIEENNLYLHISIYVTKMS